METHESVHSAVRRRYGQIARSVRAEASCCGSGGGCCGPDPISVDLYAAGELGALPPEAVLASLGCGNPTALAELRPGEVVLDLGSGGGIDVLLSARRVGPTGFAYGLDMTDEMLDLAEANRRQAGLENVRFLRGHIEAIPLPDEQVEVIISNCVVNLSPDKDAVFAEAFRVLKLGGRLAVADVVVPGEVPEVVRRHPGAWAACIGGALTTQAYRAKLEAVGFRDVQVTILRTLGVEALGDPPPAWVSPLAGRLAGSFASAFVRAVKAG